MNEIKKERSDHKNYKYLVPAGSSVVSRGGVLNKKKGREGELFCHQHQLFDIINNNTLCIEF